MVSMWLPGDNEIDVETGKVKKDFEVITKNRVVIKNLEKYNELMRLLKDRNSYIKLEKENGKDFGVSDRKETCYYRTIDGFEYAHFTDSDLYWGDYASIEEKYINPRANLARLLNLDDYRKDISYGVPRDFLVLEKLNFDMSCLVNGDISELETIVKVLEHSNLNKEKLIKLLKRDLGEFGWFVVDALSCVDFEKVEEYKKSEFGSRIDFINREIEFLRKNDFADNISHSYLYDGELTELKGALAGYEVAETNHKVLSLARRLHNKVK